MKREEKTCETYIHVGNALMIGFSYAFDKYGGTEREKCLTCPIGRPMVNNCLEYKASQFNWEGMWGDYTK